LNCNELDELLELVEQPPLLPLTLVEVLGVCAVDELLLQLYAFATFGAVVIGAGIEEATE